MRVYIEDCHDRSSRKVSISPLRRVDPPKEPRLPARSPMSNSSGSLLQDKEQNTKT